MAAVKARPPAAASGDGSILLMGEVALAVVLLAGAGLLIRSFANLASVDPGFRPANLVTMKLSLPDVQYADGVKRAAFTRNVLRRVAAIPGVRSASAISVLPMRSYFLSLPANVRALRTGRRTRPARRRTTHRRFPRGGNELPGDHGNPSGPRPRLHRP